MGVFDSSSFTPPSGLGASDDPSLPELFNLRDQQKRKDLDYQKELMDFQSNLRFNEMAKNMNYEQTHAPQTSPMSHMPLPGGAAQHSGQPAAQPPMKQFFMKNPNDIDPYQQGELNLGKEKLNVTRELGLDKNKIAEQTVGIKSKLASLHNLSDSDKLKMLQEGKISLQELKDSDAMDRIDESGNIKSDQITQQGNIKSGQIEQKGNIDTDLVHARGEEARTTKGTPSADAGVTANLPTQQIKAHQTRASQAVQDNPHWRNWISIDSNGQVQLQPPSEHWYESGPTKSEYDQMVSYMRNTPPTKQPSPVATAPKGDTTTSTTATKPTATSTTTTKPTTNTTPVITQPNTTPTSKPGMAKAKPDTTGAIEMLTPDGKSTRMVPANQVDLATKQGYKPKGQ